MKEFPKRGSVYWVKLDPAIGTETKKTRPGLIVSNDEGNEISSRVIVAPITSSTNKIYPFEVELETDEVQGKAMLDQIRAVDKRRLGKKITFIPSHKIKEVDTALKLVLALG